MSIFYDRGQVWDCYLFARRMRGNHNPNMIMGRSEWEIFRDDFRGKLGEVALKNYIIRNVPNGSYETITADFRKYPCVEDSVADHSAYLLGAKNGRSLRYKGIKGMTDYKKVGCFSGLVVPKRIDKVPLQV